MQEDSPHPYCVQGPDPMQPIADSQEPQQFDICIANILQGPLLDLQPRLSGYTKPQGQLLLLGILVSQVTITPYAFARCNALFLHLRLQCYMRLSGYTTPQGHLLLSGILVSQMRHSTCSSALHCAA